MMRPTKCAPFFLLWVASVAAIGCSVEAKTHPVIGKVLLTDGTPVERGVIEFRTTGEDGAVVNAHGLIESDGSFRLTTFDQDDGAVLGEHQAIVLNPATTDGGPVIHAPFAEQYRDYSSSDLKFQIEPGANEIIVQLKRR